MNKETMCAIYNNALELREKLGKVKNGISSLTYPKTEHEAEYYTRRIQSLQSETKSLRTVICGAMELKIREAHEIMDEIRELDSHIGRRGYAERRAHDRGVMVSDVETISEELERLINHDLELFNYVQENFKYDHELLHKYQIGVRI